MTRGGRDVHWSGLDLDGLIDAYWEVIAPAMREDGRAPESERPTHEWLSANGFRGLVYALRERHDRTFGEFWAEDLGLEADDGYDWGIAHGRTVEALEGYLDSRRRRSDLDASSVRTLRYRLAKYVRAHAAANDAGGLLAAVAPDGDVPPHEATDAAWAAFDRLDDELAPRTTRRIHGAVDDWYAHLIRRKRAAVNPVAGLEEEYRWGRRAERDDGPSNPSLAAEHVRALSAAAASLEESLLVVALCAWGLRSGEVAALHRRQLVLDDPESDVPYVAFADRKNGPGRVSVVFGRDVAEERLGELAAHDGWNGYLFPSDRSAAGHVSRQTLLNRFDELVERAGLPEEIGGRKPVPQMGRRFWYDAFSGAQESLLEGIGEVAAEQGSASAGVVLSEYLSEDRRRTLRREHMRARLAEAFDRESGTPP